jgi:hypothetical protein
MRREDHEADDLAFSNTLLQGMISKYILYILPLVTSIQQLNSTNMHLVSCETVRTPSQ